MSVLGSESAITEAGTPSIGTFRNTFSQIGITIVLPLAMLLLYAATVFVLPQQRDHTFVSERSSLAAAVSRSVYGARFGAVYPDVLDHFAIDPASIDFDGSLQKVFDRTPQGIRLQNVQPVTNDGYGVGFVFIATAAIATFGLKAWSLPLLTIALMALSTLAFLWRFSKEFSGVAVSYFGCLTVMLFTPLVWDPWTALGIPIGGIRYFSLVAMMPAFHLMFELLDTPGANPGSVRRDVLLVGVQTAILMLAALVRASAEPLIGGIALIGCVLGWRARRDPERSRPLIYKGATILLIGTGFVAVTALAAPEYTKSGRSTTVFWHRVLISLSINPAWPYGDVAERYNCDPELPNGMRGASGDTVGACVWLDYARRHGMSHGEMLEGQLGGRYEIVMRDTFFDIARRYPGEVLTTFLYYKPLGIFQSIVFLMRTDLTAYPRVAFSLLFATLLGSLAGFYGSTRLPSSNWRRVTRTALLLASLTVPPYLVAWALPYTTADLFFFCIFFIELGAAVLVARLFAWSRALAPLPN